MQDKYSRTMELYNRSLNVIPGASQTFSKSALVHVLGTTPLFLAHGKGCHVTDVDGNKYVDFILGLMPIVLGYQDPDVNKAIKLQLDKGITFSLSTELEITLAEKLISTIPCAEMVRFGKNGSDATTAAIRLARAYTGKTKIVSCGYHGWHDWYIGSTTRNLGVPKEVQNLSFACPFNDINALNEIVEKNKNDTAAIILEPESSFSPKPNYLEQVQEISRHYGSILIFDEIITGFRCNMGGAQKKYNVTPDLACFGKAMANGMPISAVVGKKDIMKLMDDIFFSATFGGETLSITAALATINKIEQLDGPAKLHRRGRLLEKDISALLRNTELDDIFSITGPDWWPHLSYNVEARIQKEVAISLLRQELVGEGILMGNTFNLCLEHDDDHVQKAVVAAWSKALGKVADHYSHSDPSSCLRGRPIQPVFQVRN